MLKNSKVKITESLQLNISDLKKPVKNQNCLTKSGPQVPLVVLPHVEKV